MISSLGNVKSLYTNKILKFKNDKDGYLQVNLYKNHKQYTFKVHKLVAQAFISNVNSYKEINHIYRTQIQNRPGIFDDRSPGRFCIIKTVFYNQKLLSLFEI